MNGFKKYITIGKSLSFKNTMKILENDNLTKCGTRGTPLM